MEAEKSKPTKYRTPLRQAQRDLTRRRIKDAARNLFYEQHYDSTTMDEIAIAAGLRRSTLYLHYKDKAEILSEVIADYVPKAREVLSTLPGPAPSVPQVVTWIKKVAKFVAVERAPLSIILELRHDRSYLGALEDLTSQLLSGLGENNPPFAEAAKESSSAMLRARGLLLFQQLTYSCELYLDNSSDPRNKALLKVTAEDFHSFLSDG